MRETEAWTTRAGGLGKGRQVRRLATRAGPLSRAKGTTRPDGPRESEAASRQLALSTRSQEQGPLPASLPLGSRQRGGRGGGPPASDEAAARAPAPPSVPGDVLTAGTVCTTRVLWIHVPAVVAVARRRANARHAGRGTKKLLRARRPAPLVPPRMTMGETRVSRRAGEGSSRRTVAA